MTYQILCECLFIRQQESTKNGFSEMTDGLMIEDKSHLVLQDDEQNSSFLQSSISMCSKLQ